MLKFPEKYINEEISSKEETSCVKTARQIIADKIFLLSNIDLSEESEETQETIKNYIAAYQKAYDALMEFSYFWN